MGLPLLAGLVAAKFAAKAFLIRAYGEKNIYRSILKSMKQIDHIPKERIPEISETIKAAFRAPKETIAVLSSSSGTLDFLQKYGQGILQSFNKRV